VAKYFHGSEAFVGELEVRLTEMESQVERYERNLIDLGQYAF
jgi:hypothetical protein